MVVAADRGARATRRAQAERGAPLLLPQAVPGTVDPRATVEALA